MDLYKRRDKIIKNDSQNMKYEIVKSCKFAKLYMKDRQYEDLLKEYCDLIIAGRHVMIDHYLQNKVCGYFLAWMIAEGNFNAYRYEMLIPYIIKDYRAMYNKLRGNMGFLNEIKEKMNMHL